MFKKIFILFLFANMQQLFAEEWMMIKDLGNIPQKKIGGIASYDTNYYMASYFEFDFHNWTINLRLIKTTDYGVLWEPVLSIDGVDSWGLSNYSNMQFISKDTIYGFFSIEKQEDNKGLVCFIKSTDGAKSWDTTMIYRKKNLRFANMHFKNSKEGIISTGVDTILKTYDGGEVWKEISLPKTDNESYFFRNISVIGDFVVGCGYRSSPYKKILLSEDYGETWEIIDDDYDWQSSNSRSITIRSKNEWWVTGTDHDSEKKTYLKRTTDRGQTWEEIKSNEFFGPGRELYFFNDSNKIIFRTLGGIYKSTDNGNSWKEIPGWPEYNSQPDMAAFPSFTKGMILESYKMQIWKLDKSTSVKDNFTQETAFLIHPNPASDYIEISLNQPTEGSELAIYDVLGNRVWKSTINTLTPTLSLRAREQRIDISHLPGGVYFVRFGERVEKFVKK